MQIKWLLRDEIASAMLHTCHLKEANLEMVVAHVESSHNARNCISESIPLNFVCGMEQSKERFMQVHTHSHTHILYTYTDIHTLFSATIMDSQAYKYREKIFLSQ